MESLIAAKQSWIDAERRAYLLQQSAHGLPYGGQANAQNVFNPWPMYMQGIANMQGLNEPKLARAQRIAAEVRARHPEMQVRRLTNSQQG
jgi:hypothetical protein